MNPFLKICLLGYTTLVFAIFLNVGIMNLRMYTWYDMMKVMDITSVSIPNLLVLVFAYPIALGSIIFLIDKILKK
jgi:hypothetical protein